MLCFCRPMVACCRPRLPVGMTGGSHPLLGKQCWGVLSTPHGAPCHKSLTPHNRQQLLATPVTTLVFLLSCCLGSCSLQHKPHSPQPQQLLAAPVTTLVVLLLLQTLLRTFHSLQPPITAPVTTAVLCFGRPHRPVSMRTRTTLLVSRADAPATRARASAAPAAQPGRAACSAAAAR